MTIRRKLLTGFGAVALAIILVGGVAFFVVEKMGREYEKVTEDILPVSTLLEQVYSDGLEIVHATSEYGRLAHDEKISREDLQRGQESLKSSLFRYWRSLAAYESRVQRLPEEKILLDEIRLSGEDLQRVSRQILTRLEDGDRQAALSLAPQLKEAETELLQHVQSARDLEARDLDKSRSQVAANLASARSWILFSTGGALLVALTAGGLVARRLSGSLVRLQRIADGIGNGAFDLPFEKPSEDEIGALGTTLERMAALLKHSHEEIVSARNYLDSVFRSLSDSIIVVAPDGRIRSANPATLKLLNYAEEELLGANMEKILDPESCQAMLAGSLGGISRIGAIQEVYRTRDGDGIPVSLSVAALRDHRNEPGGMVCLARDITESRQAEKKIQRLAYFDQLTQLPNRTLFMDRLNQALAKAQRDGERLAVFFFDLDRFKDINDSLGHASGDLLLQQVARRLEGRTRKSDTLARLGGDEFVLISEIRGEREAVEIAQGVLELVGLPFDLDGREVIVSTSVGIVLYPEDGITSEALLKHADMAMYAAKARGKGLFEFFSPEMNRKAQERRGMEARLRRALRENEFFLHYQPQFDLATGALVGLEALLRWKDPDRGLVPPGTFIRFAEETGLIHPLGEWVLRTACAQGRQWQQCGLPPVRLAVNLSGYQFSRPDFMDMIDRVLEDTEFDPGRLELELTESTLMSSASATIATLLDLKVRGIHLAVDDFGTGYSSLNYLKHFPINRLKIDRSFVRGIPGDKDNAAIVQAILAMAHSLGLRVVAEGVETEEELEFLRDRQCDEIQCFLLSRPLSPEEVEPLLHAAADRPGHRLLFR